MLDKYREAIRVDASMRPNALNLRGLEETIQSSLLNLRDPNTDDEEFREIEAHDRVWSLGDKMYKLAYEHYGSTAYWWVIAWYNNKPTDAHINLGEVIMIPTDLEYVVELATRK